MLLFPFIETKERNYIVWTDLKKVFETWYLSNYHKKPPNGKDVKKYFEKNYFACDEHIYKGNDGKNFRGWMYHKLVSENDE